MAHQSSENHEDYVDLTSVNKTKQNIKQNRIKQLLSKVTKKSYVLNRDKQGKFAKAGSGGLSASRRFNKKLAFPLIAIFAIGGGVFVYQSFAASSTSKAQVTKWYWTCLNRAPDAGGLEYWASRIDKGESTWTVASAFMKASKVTKCNYPDRSPMTSKKPTTPTPVEDKNSLASIYKDSANLVTLVTVTRDNITKSPLYLIQFDDFVPYSKVPSLSRLKAFGQYSNDLAAYIKFTSEINIRWQKLSSSDKQTAHGISVRSILDDQLGVILSLKKDLDLDYKVAERVYEAYQPGTPGGIVVADASNGRGSSSGTTCEFNPALKWKGGTQAAHYCKKGESRVVKYTVNISGVYEFCGRIGNVLGDYTTVDFGVMFDVNPLVDTSSVYKDFVWIGDRSGTQTDRYACMQKKAIIKGTKLSTVVTGNYEGAYVFSLQANPSSF